MVSLALSVCAVFMFGNVEYSLDQIMQIEKTLFDLHYLAYGQFLLNHDRFTIIGATCACT
jgi:hypothetical protein